ncbi:hypothetical protein [Embleya sp. NPDC059237]|uniref:hypothetical protein n=1 Tax=Embleya sp. NPDC059237 TaxID=3346784 RepID=UPI0036A30067
MTNIEHDSITTRVGHHAWKLSILGLGIIVASYVTIDSFALLVTLMCLGLVVTVAADVYGFSHGPERPCLSCRRSEPDNGAWQAHELRGMLRAHHVLYHPGYHLGVLVSPLVLIWLLPGHFGVTWLLWMGAQALPACTVPFHRPVRAWCPSCNKGGGGGGHDDIVAAPDPASPASR